MRILHMIPTLTGGGAERQLEYLAAELARRGHDVRVAYMHDGSGPWRGAPAEAVKLAPLRPWDPRLVTRTVSLLREWRPDVLHTWIVQMDVVGGIAAKLAGTPWVLREPTSAVFYRQAIKARLRIAVARAGAAAVAANSAGGIDYWTRHAPKLRRLLIENAVPLEAIDATPAATFARPTALYAGRLETLKNVNVAIAAAAEVMRETDLELLICGDGPERARLEGLARELGVGDRVRFAGFVESVWPAMKAARFFVSLSDFEGQPNAVLEAFAAGTPAILSDIPPHRAIADDAAASFAAREPGAVAAAMRRMLADPSAAAAQARAARRRVEARSIGAMTDAYERLYREVAR
jgi:glycosyltransferase involved in cell wall biosynthesis